MSEEEQTDASRRTRLAAERTLLAWWRTGLGALAVGVGVGRLVPELSNASTQWPYAVLGLAFSLYGIVLILYGSRRFSAVERALQRGGYASLGPAAVPALGAAAAVLAAMTGALILFGG